MRAKNRTIKTLVRVFTSPRSSVCSNKSSSIDAFSSATCTPAPRRTVSISMDTSNPAVFVNGALLRLFVGRRVRTVVQVVGPDGASVVAKSTDDQQLIIKGNPPNPLTTFVEVIGIADSNQSIRAEIWSNFGDSFEPHTYNQLCQLANGEFKHLFL